MVPASILAILVFIFTLGNIKITMKPRSDEAVHERKWFRIIGTTLSLLLIIFSTPLPIVIPVMTLPHPSGNYAIGRKYFHFIESNTQKDFES